MTARLGLASIAPVTTGFFFFVKRKDVIELDITVENAMTILISAGMVQPEGDENKKFSALAANARAAQALRKKKKETVQ